MSRRQVVLWKCDRCGKEVPLPTDMSAPAGWSQIKSAPIDQDSIGDRSWEVCAGCYSQVERLLQPVNEPNNGASE